MAICFGRSFQVFAFLRHFMQLSCIAREGIAAQAITVSELHGFTFTGRIAIALCLMKRVGTSIEVLQPVDESSCQPKERIRPASLQFGGFSKCRNGLGQILCASSNWRLLRLASPLIRCKWPSQ